MKNDTTRQKKECYSHNAPLVLTSRVILGLEINKIRCKVILAGASGFQRSPGAELLLCWCLHLLVIEIVKSIN